MATPKTLQGSVFSFTPCNRTIPGKITESNSKVLERIQKLNVKLGNTETQTTSCVESKCTSLEDFKPIKMIGQGTFGKVKGSLSRFKFLRFSPLSYFIYLFIRCTWWKREMHYLHAKLHEKVI